MQAVLGQRIPPEPSDVIWAATSRTEPKNSTKMGHSDSHYPKRTSYVLTPTEKN